MSNASATILLRRACPRTAMPGTQELSDRELVERFAAGAQEEAFEALLRRHGPMVSRVCRRILRNEQDAEDAFQATFLVFARKAGQLRRGEAVAGWLHGVARRTALKAREQARRRATHEQHAVARQTTGPLDELTVREAQELFDEALTDLPEKYRAPLILCHLEGATRDEAARRLEVPLGTLKTWLERGRVLLRERLARRGVTLTAVLFAATLGEGRARAVLPAPLLRSTVGAARAFAAGREFTGAVPAQVQTLAEGVLRSMATTPLKGTTALLVCGLAGLGLLLAGGPARERREPPPPAVPAKEPRADALPRTDLHGDPLPPGAVLRLGTLRFRHETWVSSVAVSPDGKRIAVSGNGKVRLWDAATGKESRRFDLPQSYFTPVAFSPDGKALATGSGDHLIRLWDPASGKLQRQFVGHQKPAREHDTDRLAGISQIVFSPNGKTLASLGADRKVRLWDVASARELHQFDPPPRSNLLGRTLAFSPGGDTLVAGGMVREEGGVIIVWDTATGKQRRLWETPSAVASLALSPDGKTLATGASDPKKGPGIVLWDPATGKERRRLETGHKRMVVWVAFSSDGKVLVSPDDTVLRRWDVASGKELRRIPVGAIYRGVTFLDDDKVLLSWGAANTVHFWDVHTGKPVRRFAGHEGQLADVTFSPDGKTVATAGGSDHRVGLWDAASGKLARWLEEGNEESNVTDVAFSPDGKVLAAANAEGTIRLWQPDTNKLLRRLEGHHEWGAIRVAFSPDGKLLASSDSGMPRTVRVWDIRSGKEVWRWQWDTCFPVSSLAFSPDGRTLAAGGGESQSDPRQPTLRAWNVATGKEVPLVRPAVPTEHNPLTFLTFSPDGRMLATVSNTDDVIRLWERSTGKERLRIRHPNHVTSLVFSPDGRLLASANGDFSASRGPKDPGNEGWEVIHLWDTLTGKEIHRFTGYRARLSALAFSPDGKRLASSSFDTTALIWDVGAVLAARRPERTDLSREELKGLWADLSGADAARAYRAIGKMMAAPARSVPFLKERLRPVSPAGPKRIARLLTDLDSDTFAVREKATRELEKLGPAAGPFLREALEGGPPIEVRKRLERLLEKLKAVPPLQGRAVEVLERIGNPEARQVLRSLAEGVPEAWLTQEARHALRRLQRGATSAGR